MLSRGIRVFLWVVVFQVVSGAIGGLSQSASGSWYASLAKPELNPPGWVFGVVWPILYVMIAVAGERIWHWRGRPGGSLRLGLFAAQTLLNWGWTPLFFVLHATAVAFAWILALDVVVALLVIACWRGGDRMGAWLLVPYLLWGVFAAYLNGSIWLLN